MWFLNIVTTPATTQHNLNNVVWLDTKMTMHTTPPQKLKGGIQEPQIDIDPN